MRYCQSFVLPPQSFLSCDTFSRIYVFLLVYIVLYDYLTTQIYKNIFNISLLSAVNLRCMPTELPYYRLCGMLQSIE